MITERLIKIKKRCEELLAIAVKRTPGEWGAKFGTSNGWDIDSLNGRRICVEAWHDGLNQDEYTENGTFIASCAGPTEAGWRSTIIAIDVLQRIYPVDLSPCDGGSCLIATQASDSLQLNYNFALGALGMIIDAWQEEPL